MGSPEGDDFDGPMENLSSAVADPELREGELSRTSSRLPMVWPGNFAFVYRVHCPKTGNTWAVKCFTRAVPDRQARYRQIAAHLHQARLPFTVDFQYLEQGIRVEGNWYPIVKMRWVEGQTLNKFIQNHLDRPGMLRQLLQLWPSLARRLREADMAHADLQHCNVLLVPHGAGQLALRLVDYDGMYVPGLEGTDSGERGHPAYQHPQRLHEGTYNAEVDRFSHLVIYTAVRCLTSGHKDLWLGSKYNNDDNLLFRQSDLDRPGESELFYRLWESPDPDVRRLVGWLALARHRPLEQAPLLDKIIRDGTVQPLEQAEESAVRELLGTRTATVPVGPGVGEVEPASPAAELASPDDAAAIESEPTRVRRLPRIRAAPFARKAWRALSFAAAPLRFAGRVLWAVPRRIYRFYARVFGEESILVNIVFTGLTLVALVVLGSFGAKLAAPMLGNLAAKIVAPFNPAEFALEVDPPRAEVTVSGENATLEGAGAQRTLIVSGPNGEEVVTITATLPGYEPLTQEIRPQPRESRDLLLHLKPLPATYALAVDPPEAEVKVVGENATLDGAAAERTLIVSTPNGQETVTIRATMAGYEPLTREIRPQPGESRDLLLHLKPLATATYALAVDPPEAEVKVSGENAILEGTGAERTLTCAEPDGHETVTIMATLADHEPLTREIRPQPGESRDLLLHLKPFPATYTLAVDPPEAEVYVSGHNVTLKGRGAERTLTCAASDGHETVTIMATLADHEPLTREIRPQPRESRELLLHLKPLPATYALAVDPPEAEVKVSGENATLEGAGAERRLIVSRPNAQETVTVTATMAGYEPLTREIRPQPGESRQFILRLQFEGITVELGLGVVMDMVRIPAGSFMMGSPEDEEHHRRSEGPVHKVNIRDAFYLGKYEVTQEQWEAVMGDNPSLFKGAKRPVEEVSWNDCEGFLDKLNALAASTAAKGHFRLPTEAEWEYACRAGTTTRFCWGDSGLESVVNEHCWYDTNTDETQHVGQKRPNAWGLYDVSGNVEEWCQDWCDLNYYDDSPTDDPTGPRSGSDRVLRGGSHFSREPAFLRCAKRYGIPPDSRSSHIGFRVAMTLTP